MDHMRPKGRPEGELHRSAQREGSPVTLTLDTVGIAAGMYQQRDRVAVAGGVR